jgi:hypothetical protein
MVLRNQDSGFTGLGTNAFETSRNCGLVFAPNTFSVIDN